jgi:hypothetical protein
MSHIYEVKRSKWRLAKWSEDALLKDMPVLALTDKSLIGGLNN